MKGDMGGPFEGPVEIAVVVIGLFMFLLLAYLILSRIYLSWINDLLACKREESKTEMFKRLFTAYLKLSILVTFGLFITISGLTASVSLFDFTVLYFSSFAVLFIVRAAHTMPMRVPPHAHGAISELVAVACLGAVVGLMRFTFLLFWSPTIFSEIAQQLFGPWFTLTFSLDLMLKSFIAYVFPPLLVSSALEAFLFGVCKLGGISRKYTE